MPRSRRRHRSHSRSRSRSHSYDRDREPKRRKIDGYDSPRHKRSLSCDDEEEQLHENEDITQESFVLKLSETDDTANLKDDDDDDENEEKLSFDDFENDFKDKTENDHINNSSAVEFEEKLEKTAELLSEDETELKSADDELQKNISDYSFNWNLAEIEAKIKEKISKSFCDGGKPISPKNLQKKVEIELRKEKQRLMREEKERKRQEMKEEREKQRQEKEEQRKKEKEIKEERKKKEREEKEKKRKEKEEMEEQKRKEREQEKLKKQQDIMEKSKEKQKLKEQKQKTVAAFVSFFKKKEDSLENNKKNKETLNDSLFMPFEIKSDMRLAPIVRIEINQEKKDKLLSSFNEQNAEVLYLEEIKNGKNLGRSSKTYSDEENDTTNDDDDDVVALGSTSLGNSIIDEGRTTSTKIRAKCLKFHDNRRPAYYGTFRKTSKFVRARKPFARDLEIFDYEFDSDDDWEDEDVMGEVESLKGSDEEEKETSDNEYEVDNQFFVPHGHLSEDEINEEEEDKPFSPETHKAQLKFLKNEFEEEMKNKTTKIKPRVIGCVWQNENKENNDVVDETIKKFLEPFSIISLGPIVINKRNNESILKNSNIPKKRLEKEHVPAFLNLIHGNVRKRKFIVDEFLEYLKNEGFEINVSKLSLNKELKQFASWTKCPDEGPMQNRLCWYVPESVRDEFGLKIKLPNISNYDNKKSSS